MRLVGRRVLNNVCYRNVDGVKSNAGGERFSVR